MEEFERTTLNKVQRLPQRGHYDRETVYAIVDEALICHVGFVFDGRPFVLPTIHVRVNDTIYLHGAVANRMLGSLSSGNPVCLTMTLIDGIVFARSVFHHSMNYRSVVIFGKGREVTDRTEKDAAFLALTEHIAKGRWDEARIPNERETKSTMIIAVEIESASAKIRTGPAKDDEEDYNMNVWAGILPVRLSFGEPIKDDRLPESIPVPEYLTKYRR